MTDTRFNKAPYSIPEPTDRLGNNMKMNGQTEAALLTLVYFTASTSTTLLNKIIISNFKFNMHLLLIFIQSGLIAIMMWVSGNIMNISINLKRISRWLTVTMILVAMMVTNLKLVYYFPVNLITLYKNASIIIVALIEWQIFDSKLTILQYVSFILITISAYGGKLNDKTELIGYIWMVANIASTAGYTLYLRWTLKKINEENREEEKQRHKTRLESVFYTNLLSLPFTLILIPITEKFNIPNYDSKVWVLVLLSAVAAFFTSYSTAWTLELFSSTALCTMGAINKLLLALSGIIILKEEAGLTRIISLLIGIGGGFLYALATRKHITKDNEEI